MYNGRVENRDNFTLRPATAADQEAIKTLIRSVGINPLSLKWPYFILAVDNHGQMIGCGQVKQHRDGSHELASIAVVKAWRKKGVARSLIEHLIMHSQEEVLWLTCMSPLRPFYQQFAFREVTNGEEMTPYFRHLYRFTRFFLRFQKGKAYVAVMRRERNRSDVI